MLQLVQGGAMPLHNSHPSTVKPPPGSTVERNKGQHRMCERRVVQLQQVCRAPAPRRVVALRQVCDCRTQFSTAQFRHPPPDACTKGCSARILCLSTTCGCQKHGFNVLRPSPASQPAFHEASRRRRSHTNLSASFIALTKSERDVRLPA